MTTAISLRINQVKDLYGNYVTDLARKLNVNPDWIYTVVNKESNWNPDIRNKFSNAYGLFQFLPSTLISLGYGNYADKNIPVPVQFEIAYKLLKSNKSYYNDLSQFYLGLFYPVALNKPDSFVLGSERSQKAVTNIAMQNSSLTKGKNYLTKKDVADFIYYHSNLLGFNIGKDFIWKVTHLR